MRLLGDDDAFSRAFKFAGAENETEELSVDPEAPAERSRWDDAIIYHEEEWNLIYPEISMRRLSTDFDLIM